MSEVATAQNLVELSHSKFIFACVTVYNLEELFVQPTDHLVESYVFRAPYGAMHQPALQERENIGSCIREKGEQHLPLCYTAYW